MRSRIATLFSIGLISALLIATGYTQEEMVLVDNSLFGDARRPASVFVHDVHNENAGLEECSECHHLYEDGQLQEGESSEDQRCGDCHNLAAEGKQPGLMKAFHLNCKGCHQAQQAGPVMCGECHKK